ncbi:SDR family oxidoreductase [Roseovarius autotrophicus]|uniref:SDR family oxidoreductase n=1 Tax=Roseovarius autotrophicus TaxID=2824121 RepID=UPI001B39C54B
MTRALVTGAGKRLGRAMALELARQGHDVAVHYATAEAEAEDVAARIRAMGRQAVTLRADLLDEAQVVPLIARAAQALGGPILTLINNASIFEYDNLAAATRTSWDRHMESNLRAPFVLMQEIARAMPEPETDAGGESRARGLVVNMIDQRVRKLTPEFMTYTIAKMGLWALTRTGAQALAPRIRVNAIGPGPALQGHRQSATHFANQRQATILGRGTDAEEICAALTYLLNAPGVTGQLICVDGGQHLGWQTPDVLGVE